MKKLVILALVCINVGLLGWVLLEATPPAEAQTHWRPNNYLVTSAKAEEDFDVVYVADLTLQRMLAFRFDRTSKKVVPLQGVDLTKDFR